MKVPPPSSSPPRPLVDPLVPEGPPWVRTLSVMIGSIGAWYVSKAPFALRGALPEPFDVVSHALNFGISGLCGTVVGTTAAVVASERPGATARSTRVVSYAAALGAGLLANVGMESEMVRNIGFVAHSTPDVIDFAYGMAGSALGGWAALKYRDPR